MEARGNRHRLWDGSDHRTSIILLLVSWALLDIALNLFALLQGSGPRVQDIPAELIIYVAGVGVSYGQLRSMQLTHGRSLWFRIGFALAGTLVCAAIFTVVARVIWETLPPAYLNPVTWDWAARNLLFWSIIFGVCAAIFVTYTYSLEMRDRERRLAVAEALAQQAETRALRYQVNPHFLYNTLNSISTLILDRQNDRADEMVMRLSAFLRSSLATGATEDVTLEREISIQRAYLDIEHVRFEDRLRIEVSVPRELGDALVPSFILQPLVENVIKHGLGPVGTKTDLEISATSAGGRLHLEVSNSCSAPTRAKATTGVGLSNVRNRLAARFGDDQSFEAGPLSDRAFVARISMPLRLADERRNRSRSALQ